MGGCRETFGSRESLSGFFVRKSLQVIGKSRVRSELGRGGECAGAPYGVTRVFRKALGERLKSMEAAVSPPIHRAVTTNHAYCSNSFYIFKLTIVIIVYSFIRKDI